MELLEICMSKLTLAMITKELHIFSFIQIFNVVGACGNTHTGVTVHKCTWVGCKERNSLPSFRQERTYSGEQQLLESTTSSRHGHLNHNTSMLWQGLWIMPKVYNCKIITENCFWRYSIAQIQIKCFCMTPIWVCLDIYTSYDKTFF